MGKKKIKKERHDGLTFHGPDLAMINEIDDLADCKLTVEREMINVGPSLGASKPDPKWTFTDTRGHYHAFSEDPFTESESELLPTVFHKTEPDDTEDDDIRSWYECRLCKEIVTPRFVPDYRAMSSTSIPGPIHWQVWITSTGPGALRMISLAGSQVSIRIKTEALDLEQFGFGRLLTERIENRGDFLVWFGLLDGRSPLGSRKIS